MKKLVNYHKKYAQVINKIYDSISFNKFTIIYNIDIIKSSKGKEKPADVSR